MDEMKKQPMGDDSKHQAKLEVLQELRNMAMELMGDKMKSHFPSDDEHEMKQVTVAAPDQEGLKKGLDMASEMSDSPHAEAGMDDDMDLDEIESMIRELEDKRREKLAQA